MFYSNSFWIQITAQHNVKEEEGLLIVWRSDVLVLNSPDSQSPGDFSHSEETEIHYLNIIVMKLVYPAFN